MPVFQPLNGLEATAWFGPAARIQASDFRNTLIEPSETQRKHDGNQQHNDTTGDIPRLPALASLHGDSVARGMPTSGAGFGPNSTPGALWPKPCHACPCAAFTRTAMRTTIEFLNLNIHNSWYRMLDQHVNHWQRLTAVSATEVIMERQLDGRPAFRVQVHLEVSSGTLHAEAIAHTLKAALVEATQDLERQIQDRQNQRIERRAHERQLSAAANPPIHE